MPRHTGWAQRGTDDAKLQRTSRRQLPLAVASVLDPLIDLTILFCLGVRFENGITSLLLVDVINDLLFQILHCLVVERELSQCGQPFMTGRPRRSPSCLVAEVAWTGLVSVPALATRAQCRLAANWLNADRALDPDANAASSHEASSFPELGALRRACQD